MVSDTCDEKNWFDFSLSEQIFKKINDNPQNLMTVVHDIYWDSYFALKRLKGNSKGIGGLAELAFGQVLIHIINTYLGKEANLERKTNDTCYWKWEDDQYLLSLQADSVDDFIENDYGKKIKIRPDFELLLQERKNDSRTRLFFEIKTYVSNNTSFKKQLNRYCELLEKDNTFFFFVYVQDVRNKMAEIISKIQKDWKDKFFVITNKAVDREIETIPINDIVKFVFKK